MTTHAMVESISKWAAGPGYGPVLTQTDVYLLKIPLELNPILKGEHEEFQLVFNLVTGETGGFNHDSRDRDLEFTQKRQPATIPRVDTLYVISTLAPWCHTVTNPTGVTLEDVLNTIQRDLQHQITDPEIVSLPPRLQDQITRTSTSRQSDAHSQWGGHYYSAAATAGHRLRCDWYRDKHFFERMFTNDGYCQKRLGFAAPNCFVMETCA
ncbi:hypothetical protein DL96DRAFT_1614354 [Flagelloscypha sp. PMI_526]|nr:hypothetical protein DL96DRAFT_1614354 [Flagelloscypha sp. PMI_526]